MKVYAASEATYMANQANQSKYKKELLSMMDGAIFIIVEAARQGKYSVEFPLDTNDEQLKDAFIHSMKTLGYKYKDGIIYWHA